MYSEDQNALLMGGQQGSAATVEMQQVPEYQINIYQPNPYITLGQGVPYTPAPPAATTATAAASSVASGPGSPHSNTTPQQQEQPSVPLYDIYGKPMQGNDRAQLQNLVSHAPPVIRTSARVREEVIMDAQKNSKMNATETLAMMFASFVNLLVVFFFWSLIACAATKPSGASRVDLAFSCNKYWNGFCCGFGGLVGPGVGFGFTMMLYLCSTFVLSPSLRHLGNKVSGNPLHFLANMTEATPSLVMKAVCSHTSSSGSGKNRRRRTVVTHRAELRWQFTSWDDVSDLVIPSNIDLLRLRLTKTVQFADQATADMFHGEFEAFKAANKRDVRQEYSVDCEIPTFCDFAMIARSKDGFSDKEGGGYLTTGIYLLASLCFLNVCFQSYFYKKTTACDLKIVKVFRKAQQQQQLQQQLMTVASSPPSPMMMSSPMSSSGTPQQPLY